MKNIIFFIGIIISLSGYQKLFGQAYFVEEEKTAVFGSINGYLDKNIYGIGAGLGIAPGDLVDLTLMAGKKFAREDDFSLTFISPQIKFYSGGLFQIYSSGLALLARYTVEDYDFENSPQFLFFERNQKNKISAYGATVYYQYRVSPKIKFIPEIGFIRNYLKIEINELKDTNSGDIVPQYEFVSQSEKDNYTELFIGFNLSQRISPKHRLIWQISGTIHEDTFGAELNVGIML